MSVVHFKCVQQTGHFGADFTPVFTEVVVIMTDSFGVLKLLTAAEIEYGSL
jgi:hypothetical protein